MINLMPIKLLERTYIRVLLEKLVSHVNVSYIMDTFFGDYGPVNLKELGVDFSYYKRLNGNYITIIFDTKDKPNSNPMSIEEDLTLLAFSFTHNQDLGILKEIEVSLVSLKGMPLYKTFYKEEVNLDVNLPEFKIDGEAVDFYTNLGNQLKLDWVSDSKNNSIKLQKSDVKELKQYILNGLGYLIK